MSLGMERLLDTEVSAGARHGDYLRPQSHHAQPAGGQILAIFRRGVGPTLVRVRAETYSLTLPTCILGYFMVFPCEVSLERKSSPDS